MGMSREQKQAEIEELNGIFSSDEMVVVTHYSGLTVEKMTELRGKLREQGARFKVTKNSLTKLALKDTQFEQIADMFTGPTGIASSQDPVAAAKVAQEFAKDNDKLIILGGAMGSKILDAEGVAAIAKLPSLDEIRSKLVGLVQAPATKLAILMQTPARNMVGVTAAQGAKSE